jgi:hypothetical protein
MKVTLQTPFASSVLSGDTVQIDNDQLVIFSRGQERRRVVITENTRAVIQSETAAHIPALWPSALHLLPWLLIAGMSLGLNIDYHAAMAVPWVRWCAFHGSLLGATLLCMAAVRFIALKLDGDATFTAERSR